MAGARPAETKPRSNLAKCTNRALRGSAALKMPIVLTAWQEGPAKNQSIASMPVRSSTSAMDTSATFPQSTSVSGCDVPKVVVASRSLSKAQRTSRVGIAFLAPADMPPQPQYRSIAIGRPMRRSRFGSGY